MVIALVMVRVRSRIPTTTIKSSPLSHTIAEPSSAASCPPSYTSSPFVSVSVTSLSPDMVIPSYFSKGTPMPVADILMYVVAMETHMPLVSDHCLSVCGVVDVSIQSAMFSGFEGSEDCV